MKWRTISKIIVILLLGVAFLLFSPAKDLFTYSSTSTATPFKVQAIDTMKYSRDMAEQVRSNPSAYKHMVDAQMKLILDVGATHVAIATPYDEQFIPVLKLWVDSAREHNLSVWFRGNFSGWEGWFEYPKITRETHKYLLKDFLDNHKDLFESGDIFTPCPECENGGPGDPRRTGDKAGYNQFLIDEYEISSRTFLFQFKSVDIYTSMNGDIAREIITPSVAQKLGGTILIDHYVNSVQKFSQDITSISNILDTEIGLGEFGAPIPDLNGYMSEYDQAQYVDGMLDVLYTKKNQSLVVNYWTLKGGSTALVNDNGVPRQAYYTLQSYYKAPKVYGIITDPLDGRVQDVTVSVASTTYSTKSAKDGMYALFLAPDYRRVVVEKEGYKTKIFDFPTTLESTALHQIILEPIHPSLKYRVQIFIRDLKSKLYVSK